MFSNSPPLRSLHSQWAQASLNIHSGARLVVKAFGLASRGSAGRLAGECVVPAGRPLVLLGALWCGALSAPFALPSCRHRRQGSLLVAEAARNVHIRSISRPGRFGPCDTAVSGPVAVLGCMVGASNDVGLDSLPSMITCFMSDNQV